MHEIKQNRTRPEIEFLHIYSHQNEAATHADPNRQSKIDKQKKDFNNPKLYDLLVRGNEVADKLADEARRKRPPRRNWIHTPMAGSDEFYIVTQTLQLDHETDPQNNITSVIITKDILNDRRPHQWIKEQTQESIYDKRISATYKQNSRNDYLHYLPICDRKRSFQLANRKTPKKHHVYTTLARFRFHAASSMEKLHKHQYNKEWTDPYRNYMKAMYPDGNCHFCSKTNIIITEDTHHLLTCPNRTTRNDTSISLWEGIWHDIESKQQPTNPSQPRKRTVTNTTKPNPRLLKPFALQTGVVLGLHQAALAAVGAPNPLPHGLAVLSSFPEAATEYGLTPSSLSLALRELWVAPPDADALATEIATRTQCAIVSEYHQRCRTIATERNAKQLYKLHVLGIVP